MYWLPIFAVSTTLFSSFFLTNNSVAGVCNKRACSGVCVHCAPHSSCMKTEMSANVALLYFSRADRGSNRKQEKSKLCRLTLHYMNCEVLQKTSLLHVVIQILCRWHITLYFCWLCEWVVLVFMYKITIIWESCNNGKIFTSARSSSYVHVGSQVTSNFDINNSVLFTISWLVRQKFC